MTSLTDDDSGAATAVAADDDVAANDALIASEAGETAAEPAAKSSDTPRGIELTDPASPN